MTATGLSWDHKVGKGTRLLVALAMVFTLLPMAGSESAAADDTPIGVIVRELSPSTDTAETLVETLGGVVLQNLDIIGGFTATIPASSLAELAGDPSVEWAGPDGTVSLLGWDGKESANDERGTLPNIAGAITKAANFYGIGVTGAGVDVALIDSGVAPVEGLTIDGKVLNGPDLSFESQSPDFRHLDTFGHGTHMAGIIAGMDSERRDGRRLKRSESLISQVWRGIAPEARIVSVKVAGHDGATDVSQVIAGIDWVVQHRDDNGLNIRVLNLSFGTDSTQSYLLDPLTFAVEQAWKAGIVVVVSAGNDGNAAPLRSPANNPYVITVGAVDANGSRDPLDDQLMAFSNCGTVDRPVDVLAPGKSVVSLRNPGSRADIENPDAVEASDFFRGSGTSQAAAVVSGAAALIIDQRPEITPDQVKAILKATAIPIPGASPECQGAGLIDLQPIAEGIPTPSATQNHLASTGMGSLEAARGSDHVELDGAVLEGEQDIFGNTWDGTSWSTAAAQGTSWSGGDWNGTSWSGTSWSGTSWSGTSWSGTSWSGTSWSGTSWSGTSWSNMAWNGTSWSGTSWSGTSWSGTSWSGLSWSSAGWGDAASGVRWD